MKKLIYFICFFTLLTNLEDAKAQSKILINSKNFTKLSENQMKVRNFGALFGATTKTETVNGVKITNRFFVDIAKPLGNNKQPGVADRKPIGKASTSKENGWQCQTQNIKVRLQDDSFMSAYNLAQGKNIYPGAVYTFDNFYSGSFKSETSPRNPIYVYTSLVTNGDMFEPVEDPNSQSGLFIKNAVNKLKQRTKLNKTNQGYKMKIYECNSSAEMAMAVGAFAQGYGAKINFDWGSSKRKEDRYFLLDATQEVFSLSSSMPDEGIFKNPEDAKKTGLMYLDNVVYGMRVLVSIKTSISSNEDKLALAASYSGFGFGAGGNINDLTKTFNETTEVKVYVVGGENSGFVKTDKNQLRNAIDQAFAKLNNETAAPIYFTFRNMNNEVVRTESATDSFPVQQCIPLPPNAGLHYFNVKISLANITSNNMGMDKSTIATRVNCDLYVNGEKRQMEGQNDNQIQNETYYTPLAYFGKYDGGCEEDLLRKYGKPHGSAISFGQSFSTGNAINSFTIKMTKNELENAKIVVRVPFVTDYNKLNECTITSKSGTANKEVYLKNLIAVKQDNFSLTVPHKNDITYNFPITVDVNPTSPAEYAEEKTPNIIDSKRILDNKILNKELNNRKTNINIKKIKQ